MQPVSASLAGSVLSEPNQQILDIGSLLFTNHARTEPPTLAIPLADEQLSNNQSATAPSAHPLLQDQSLLSRTAYDRLVIDELMQSVYDHYQTPARSSIENVFAEQSAQITPNLPIFPFATPKDPTYNYAPDQSHASSYELASQTYAPARADKAPH